jgi:hypothetical protein
MRTVHGHASTGALPDGAATFDQQRTRRGKAAWAEPVEAAPRAPLITLLALPGALDPPCLLKPGEDGIDAPCLASRILGDLQPVQPELAQVSAHVGWFGGWLRLPSGRLQDLQFGVDVSPAAACCACLSR